MGQCSLVRWWRYTRAGGTSGRRADKRPTWNEKTVKGQKTKTWQAVAFPDFGSPASAHAGAHQGLAAWAAKKG